MQDGLFVLIQPRAQVQVNIVQFSGLTTHGFAIKNVSNHIKLSSIQRIQTFLVLAFNWCTFKGKDLPISAIIIFRKTRVLINAEAFRTM